MKFLIISALFLRSFYAFAETPVPDFSVQIGQDQTAKGKAYLLNFLPPKNFHFNTDAPMKVTTQDGKISFTKIGATEAHVGYQGIDSSLTDASLTDASLTDASLKNGLSIDAELYLCDDQKTMCVRKALHFPLAVNSDLKELDFSKDQVPAKKTNGASQKKKAAKDEHGFWSNDAAAAIAESIQTKKPLLIDFYGIWCPPCNLYNETVFSKKEFSKAAKNWVLLKMDADKPESFELKSHFKIGGYPTLVEVKTPTSSEVNSLSEIDRIVGFYPMKEFLTMLGLGYANRSLTLDEKLLAQKSDYLKTLQQMLEIKMEQKDWKSALVLAKDGERATGEGHYFPLEILTVLVTEKVSDKNGILKEKASAELLRAIHENRAKEKTESLLGFEDLVTAKAEAFSKEQIAGVNDVLDELVTRVVPETLSVPGVELSVADIDSMRVDVAEALSDQTAIQKANVRAAASYQKMITEFHLENSRGMNLEFAHYLWKSGSVDQAKTLYDKFIKLYPEEFTFYYAASKMYLDLKDLAQARDTAEKAVKYAYGDNKLRSVERLVRVLIAQGEKTLAVKRGNECLEASKPVSDALDVRTNHYVKALKKAVDDAEKGTS